MTREDLVPDLVKVRTSTGAEIHYEVSGWGPQHVVFVHGFRNSSDCWFPIRDLIDAERYTAWFVDLPGCGRSSTPATWEDCTVDAYSDVVREFCSSLELRDVVLVGHSLGGAIAINIALEHPSFLKAIALVAPASTTGFDYLPDEVVQQLIDATPRETGKLALGAFFTYPGDEAFARVLTTVLSASRVHVEGTMRSLNTFDVSGRLSEIDVPALLLAADRDAHVPIRSALATADAIPGCRLHVFEDVGHAIFFEVPDEFLGMLDSFIRTSELAPSLERVS